MRPKVSFEVLFSLFVRIKTQTCPLHMHTLNRGNINKHITLKNKVLMKQMHFKDSLEGAKCELADAWHVHLLWSLGLLLPGCTTSTLAFVYIMLPIWWSDVLEYTFTASWFEYQACHKPEASSWFNYACIFIVQVVLILVLQLKPAFNASMTPWISLNLEGIFRSFTILPHKSALLFFYDMF